MIRTEVGMDHNMDLGNEVFTQNVYCYFFHQVLLLFDKLTKKKKKEKKTGTLLLYEWDATLE